MIICSGDPALALACGIDDVEGERRVRERYRGHALAASSTLNRLELSTPDEAGRHRYKKVVANHEALDRLLVDLFQDSHSQAPDEIVLDLDATDDPIHGDQEGKFCHGTVGSLLLPASLRQSAASTSFAAGCARPTVMRRMALWRNCRGS